MRVFHAVAEFLGVNCWAVATEESSECILFDAGLDGASELGAILAEEELTPVALILTHGHPDHILGIASFQREFGNLPIYVHQADAYRVVDPAATMRGEFRAMLHSFVKNWHVPEVQHLHGSDCLELAGLRIEVTHTPGHTEGSCIFTVRSKVAEPADHSPHLIHFSGDVLFAGSVGRTDLPGGNHAQMAQSLEVIKDLPDAPVYPGHGPQTLLSHEKRVNPFL